MTNKLALVQTLNTLKDLNVKQLTRKNCSYRCAYDSAQLCHTT